MKFLIVELPLLLIHVGPNIHIRIRFSNTLILHSIYGNWAKENMLIVKQYMDTLYISNASSHGNKRKEYE